MKKGEITISSVVYGILIILGFAILLWVFYLIYSQLSWSGMVDRTICKQSVIYRATLPGFGGTKEFVPLKCKTAKVCITSGNGNCKEFEGSKGVTKVKVKNKEQIEQFIARDILDCWQTMGEGKVSIFSQWIAENYGVGKVYPSCVICSRIAFDKGNLSKAGINPDEINVLEYMFKHEIPDTKTSYYSYLAGEGGKMFVKNSIEMNEIKFDSEGNLLEGEKLALNLENPQKRGESKELSVLFMQISAPTHLGVIKNTLATLGIGFGGSFIAAPTLVTKASAAAIKSPWTWAILAVAGIYQQYSVAENRALTAGYCGDISIGDEAREGCSVVRTVDYNIDDINQYCSVIESIS